MGVTVWQVVAWLENIRPEDRNSTTLSDGAVFNDEQIAKHFARGVELRGGKVSSIKKHESGASWFESLEEHRRLGSMSLSEISEIAKGGEIMGAERDSMEISRAMGSAIDKLMSQLIAKESELKRRENSTGTSHDVAKMNRLTDEITSINKRLILAEKVQDSALRHQP